MNTSCTLPWTKVAKYRIPKHRAGWQVQGWLKLQVLLLFHMPRHFIYACPRDVSILQMLQVVSTMLRKMPQRMAGAMPEIVKALVAKLAAADSSPLITSLLVVLAQLAHANTGQLLDFLASQPAPGMCMQQRCRCTNDSFWPAILA